MISKTINVNSTDYGIGDSLAGTGTGSFIR